MDQESFIPNFYSRFNIGGVNIDFYFIARLYEVTDPAIAHALKKLLRAGRSHKSLEQDVKDAIDTLQRWQVLQREEAERNRPMTMGVQDEDEEEVVESNKEVEITIEYFPVRPEWREDIWSPDWDGPGWYILSDQFSTQMFSVQINGPYVARESALVCTKKFPVLVDTKECEVCGYEKCNCQCGRTKR